MMMDRRSGAGSLGGKHTFLQGAFFFRPRQGQLPRIYLKGISGRGVFGMDISVVFGFS
jgi:hypothetical protein